MNGIFFVDFNLVVCDFLKFDWCKMLNGHVDFSFNFFFSWEWFLYQSKHWEIEDGLNENLNYVKLLCFFNLNNNVNIYLLMFFE